MGQNLLNMYIIENTQAFNLCGSYTVTDTKISLLVFQNSTLFRKVHNANMKQVSEECIFRTARNKRTGINYRDTPAQRL